MHASLIAADYQLRDKRKAGRVVVQNGEVSSFTTDGLKLQDGSEIKCDTVIFGTGFVNNYNIFDAATQKALGVEADGLYLYRHMIPIDLPDLAFVGASATVTNPVTWSLMGEYIARCLTGCIELPGKETMQEEVNMMKAWKRSWMPATAGRASLILLHQTSYHDSLMRDMKEEHRRKWPNVVSSSLVRSRSFVFVLILTCQPVTLLLLIC
jgi:cation diffusion facilitator CzcD-associated flavoprotein CzcO